MALAPQAAAFGTQTTRPALRIDWPAETEVVEILGLIILLAILVLYLIDRSHGSAEPHGESASAVDASKRRIAETKADATKKSQEAVSQFEATFRKPPDQ